MSTQIRHSKRLRCKVRVFPCQAVALARAKSSGGYRACVEVVFQSENAGMTASDAKHCTGCSTKSQALLTTTALRACLPRNDLPAGLGHFPISISINAVNVTKTTTPALVTSRQDA